MHPDTDAPFEEHVIAVREEPNLHFEFSSLMSLWNAVTQKPLFDVAKCFQEVVRVPQSFEDTEQLVHVLTLTFFFLFFRVPLRHTGTERLSNHYRFLHYVVLEKKD